jgi:hypothetical protein
VVETDRRGGGRFPVNGGTTCPFAAPVAEVVGPGRVVDVSMTEVGLRLPRRVDSGAVLAVGLANPDKGFAKMVLVQVDQATPELGGCVVTGTFLTPLTYQELTALVM